MATPAFLRYLPSRLKPLGSPAVWAPLTVFLLLSIFIWESRDNPDWFNRNRDNSSTPSSQLTREEQAKLSEIDTIDVLLGETRTPSGTTTTGLANPGAPGLENTATTDPNNPNSPDSRQLAGRDDPFGAYAAEYQFPGSANAAGTLKPGSSVSSAGGASGGSSGGGVNFGGSGLTNSTAPSNTSALSQALDRQQASRDAGRQNQLPVSNSGSSGQSSFGGSAANQSAAASADPIDVPFIRTTPSMSPAVGTTGYQPPATADLPVFNIAPPQPSRNPYSPQVAPAPVAQPSALPQAGSYTAPSFTQPAQNQQVR